MPFSSESAFRRPGCHSPPEGRVRPVALRRGVSPGLPGSFAKDVWFVVPARCGKEKSSRKSSRHSPVRRPGYLDCRGGVVRGQQRRPAALRPSVAGGLPLIGGGDQWFNCGGKEECDNCERYGKVGNCGQAMMPVCRESVPPRTRPSRERGRAENERHMEQKGQEWLEGPATLGGSRRRGESQQTSAAPQHQPPQRSGG